MRNCEKSLLAVFFDLVEYIDQANYESFLSDGDIEAAEELRQKLAEGLETFCASHAAQANG